MQLMPSDNRNTPFIQFSERIGALKRTIQFQSMNERLKNRLWNVAYQIFWFDLKYSQPTRSIHEGRLLIRLGADFFALPEDDIQPRITNAYSQIKLLALKLDWARFYDLIEFIADDPGANALAGKGALAKAWNEVLREEFSGYRFIGSQLAPITSDEEIAAVESVLAQSGPLAPVAIHMATALARLADRPEPDCRNSIKESICGVEAVCQILTGDSKASLGQALNKRL
jgi:hypothetical protein